MLLMRTINTTDDTDLGINAFKKMFITNTSISASVGFTLTLKNVGFNLGVVDQPAEVNIVQNLSIPNNTTLVIEGYRQGKVYSGNDTSPQNELVTTLIAKIEGSGEVDLLIEVDYE